MLHPLRQVKGCLIRTIQPASLVKASVIEEIDAGIDAAMDQIIAALTVPLTEAESAPNPRKWKSLPGLFFQGDLEEVNRFFYKRAGPMVSHHPSHRRKGSPR